MNDLEDGPDVRRLLETATRGATPREYDPVGAVLRRRRHERRQGRRRTAGVGAGLLVACTVAAIVVLDPGAGGQGTTRTVQPATPVWSAPAMTVDEHGLNGVQVLTDEFPTTTTDGFCLVPDTVTVVTAPSAFDRSCGETFSGAGAVVQPAQVSQWTAGAPPTPGLRLLDGIPVYVNEAPYGAESRISIDVPSRGVAVELSGSETQVADLLTQVRIDPWPQERLAPVRAGTGPTLTATLTDANAAWVGQTMDPELVARLQTAVDEAVVVQGDVECVPASQQQAQLDLLTTPEWVGQPDVLSNYTFLLVDVSGTCDLVFSSTGAVLRPVDPQFTELLQQLREANDFGESA